MRKSQFAVLAPLLVATTLHGGVTGIVMTTDGQPVAGATITLNRLETSVETRTRLAAGMPRTPPVAASQTDAAGSFAIDAPADPVLQLQVTAAGFAPLARRVLSDEDLGALVVRKSPMKSGVVRAGGKAVAGARLVWHFSGGEYTTTSDSNGRYTVPDPATATSRAVFHPDFAPDLHILRPGHSEAALDISLAGGSRFTGRAIGPDRNPVPNADIWVDGWPAGKTAEDGSFTIRHMSPSWRTMTIAGNGLAARIHPSGKVSRDIVLTRAATIAGTVTDAKTRLPVAGASVVLVPASFARWENVTVNSDAKGRFSFVVPAGSWRLTPFHPGYLTRADSVDAAIGQTVVKDAALLPLALLTGTVSDEGRKPVVGATVSPQFSGSESSGGLPSSATGTASVFTGPDGRFALKVRGGELRVAASKKGLPFVETEEMAIAAGERKSGIVLVIPRGHAVSGRVTSADGRPLAGVKVLPSKVPASTDPIERVVAAESARREEQTVETAKDGTFSLRATEGRHDFAFEREGWATTKLHGVDVTPRTPPLDVVMKPSIDIAGRVVRNGAGIEGVSLFATGQGKAATATSEADGSFVLRDLKEGPIRLELQKVEAFVRETRTLTAPATDVLIEVPPGARISGRVVDEATRSAVTSFRLGVSVLRAGSGVSFDAQPLRSFSSDDGSFAIDGVTAGIVRVMISAPGYVAAASAGVTVEDGSSVEDLLIEMERGVRVTGRITSPDGAAVTGALVREVSIRSSTRSTAMNASASTDAGGEYVLDAVEPGDKSFEFSHPDYVAVTRDAKVSGREVRLDVRLEGGVTVTGSVVSGSGVPVEGATVMASPAGSNRVADARTDRAGHFRIEHLKPGRYAFTASKAGLVEGRLRDVEIPQTSSIRITMQNGATIYGRVKGLPTDESGGVLVRASSADADSVRAITDSTGNYRLEGIAPGEVTISAWVSSGSTERSSRRTQIEVAAGEIRQVDLEFDAGATITGRITRGGRPLAGSTVSFWPRNGQGGFVTARADDQGIYVARGLDDGEHNVDVADVGRTNRFRTIHTVRGSGTFDIDVPAARLSGRVIDSTTGRPLPDALITLRGAANTSGDDESTTVGDVNGAFAFVSVSPGSYTITAMKQGFASRTTELAVSATSANEVELQMTPSEGVHVRLVDARGNKPVRGWVTLRHPKGGPSEFGASHEGVRIYVEPGTYTAIADALGYAPRTFTLTSPGTVTVGLTPGGTVEIRSTATAKRKLQLMIPLPPAGAAPPAMVLAPGRTITLPNQPPGSLTLQLLDENDVLLRTVTVQVVEGQTVRVDV